MTSDEVRPKCSHRADGADVLGDGRRERDDVVLRGLLDFFDAGDVERAALADVAGGFGGDDAGARHRVGGCNFNLQPRFVLALVAPDATHLGVRIPLDHLSTGSINRATVAPSESADR